MAIINFDARAVEPDAGRGDPVPPGWYNAVAEELRYEPTSDGLGNKITGIFQIVDGPHRGRKVFHNFNMKNNSEKAQAIGHAQFSALCHACRVLLVQDTAQLLNIPLKLRLKITPAQGQYDAKNEITAFKDVNDAAAVSAMAAASATPGPVAAGKPSAPPTPPAAPTAPAGWAAPAAAPAPAAPAAPAAAAPPPQWQAPAAAQPWGNPAAAEPVPNVAPPMVAPAPQPTAAPQQAAPSAPAEGQAMPPWMQPAQPA